MQLKDMDLTSTGIYRIVYFPASMSRANITTMQLDFMVARGDQLWKEGMRTVGPGEVDVLASKLDEFKEKIIAFQRSQLTLEPANRRDSWVLLPYNNSLPFVFPEAFKGVVASIVLFDPETNEYSLVNGGSNG